MVEVEEELVVERLELWVEPPNPVLCCCVEEVLDGTCTVEVVDDELAVLVTRVRVKGDTR